jgi:hypothetical protein
MDTSACAFSTSARVMPRLWLMHPLQCSSGGHGAFAMMSSILTNLSALPAWSSGLVLTW